MRSGDQHYIDDLVGSVKGLPGAGILGWVTGDQLHPPMLADEAMWSDGQRWREGAERYVLQLGEAVGLSCDSRILDIGCGLCGPARLLVDTFGVHVTAITNSKAHFAVSREINERSASHSSRIDVVYVADLDSWPRRSYDVAWCVNMLYQVYDHPGFFAKVAEVLVSGSHFLIDDWMASSLMTEDDLRRFEFHFQYRNIAQLGIIEALLGEVGFWPADVLLDRGSVGRGLMRKHFEKVMRRDFLPQLVRQWPDVSEVPFCGQRMVDDFVEAVNLTIDLYLEGKLTYRTLIAERK